MKISRIKVTKTGSVENGGQETERFDVFDDAGNAVAAIELRAVMSKDLVEAFSRGDVSLSGEAEKAVQGSNVFGMKSTVTAALSPSLNSQKLTHAGT